MNAEARMQTAYVSVGGKNTALPWATIITIVLELLQGCSTKDAKAFAKNHPLALEFMLTRKLRSDGALGAKEAKLVAKAGVITFVQAPAAEIESIR